MCDWYHGRSEGTATSNTAVVLLAFALVIGALMAVEPAAAANPPQSSAAPLSTGTLKVVGQMFNTNGALFPLPQPMAAFSVTCSLSGPNLQNLVLQNQSQYSYVAAAGSNCSVVLQNENPMTPVAHYQGCGGTSASWTKQYSPQQVLISAGVTTAMTFTQRLTCDPVRKVPDALPPTSK